MGNCIRLLASYIDQCDDLDVAPEIIFTKEYAIIKYFNRHIRENDLLQKSESISASYSTFIGDLNVILHQSAQRSFKSTIESGERSLCWNNVGDGKVSLVDSPLEHYISSGAVITINGVPELFHAKLYFLQLTVVTSDFRKVVKESLEKKEVTHITLNNPSLRGMYYNGVLVATIDGPHGESICMLQRGIRLRSIFRDGYMPCAMLTDRGK